MDKSHHVKDGPGLANQAAPEWTGDKPKPDTKPTDDDSRSAEDRKLREDIHRPFKGVGSL